MPSRIFTLLRHPGFDDGVPINMVQRVMGHERSITTLGLYARLYARRTNDEGRILRALSDATDEGYEDEPW